MNLYTVYERTHKVIYRALLYTEQQISLNIHNLLKGKHRLINVFLE